MSRTGIGQLQSCSRSGPIARASGSTSEPPTMIELWVGTSWYLAEPAPVGPNFDSDEMWRRWIPERLDDADPGAPCATDRSEIAPHK
jgi:hypothetical protein